MTAKIIIALLSAYIAAESLLRKKEEKKANSSGKQRSKFWKVSIISASIVVLGITIVDIINTTKDNVATNSRNIRIEKNLDTTLTMVDSVADLVEESILSIKGSNSTLELLQVRMEDAIHARGRLISDYEEINRKIKHANKIDSLTLIERGPNVEILDNIEWRFDHPQGPVGIRIYYSNSGVRLAYEFSSVIEYYELDTVSLGVFKFIDFQYFPDVYQGQTIIPSLSISKKRQEFNYLMFAGETQPIQKLPYGAIIRIRYTYKDKLTNELKSCEYYYYWIEEHKSKNVWSQVPQNIIEIIERYKMDLDNRTFNLILKLQK